MRKVHVFSYGYYTYIDATIFGVLLVFVFATALMTYIVFLITDGKECRNKQTTKGLIGLYFVLPAVLIVGVAGGVYLGVTNYSTCTAIAGKETSIVCTANGKKYHVAFDEKTSELSFTGEPGTKSMTVTLPEEK